MPDLSHYRVKTSQLQCCIIGAVANMMAECYSLIRRYHFLEQILMITPDKNQLFSMTQDKLLKSFSFLAAVKEIAKNYQLMWLRVSEIT